MLDNATSSEMACFLYPWLGLTKKCKFLATIPAQKTSFSTVPTLSIILVEHECHHHHCPPAHQNLLKDAEVTYYVR